MDERKEGLRENQRLSEGMKDNITLTAKCMKDYHLISVHRTLDFMRLIFKTHFGFWSLQRTRWSQKCLTAYKQVKLRASCWTDIKLIITWTN